MSKIKLICPYFGDQLPWYIDTLLLSFKHNSHVELLIPTDCQVPTTHPKNVTFIEMTLSELSALVLDKLKLQISINNGGKVCDFKPFFGKLFEDHLIGYDWWGFIDADIILGNFSKFITPDMLESYDVISSRKNCIGGHFTLIRNKEVINSLCSKDYKIILKILGSTNWTNIEEDEFSSVIRDASDVCRVKWDQYLVNFPTDVLASRTGDLSVRPSRLIGTDGPWVWHPGELKYQDKQDVLYFHIHRWKQIIQSINFTYDDDPDMLTIDRLGIIHSKDVEHRVFNYPAVN